MKCKKIAITFVCLGVLSAACGSMQPVATATNQNRETVDEPADKNAQNSSQIVGKCQVTVNDDGDTVVSNDSDGFAIALGGTGWDINCSDPKLAFKGTSEGLIVTTVKADKPPANTDNNTFILSNIASMQTHYAKTLNYTPSTPKNVMVSDNPIPAKCFSGPMMMNESPGVMYACVTLKTPSQGPLLLTTVTYIVEKEVWINQEPQVIEAVEGTSGSWFTQEELEE